MAASWQKLRVWSVTSAARFFNTVVWSVALAARFFITVGGHATRRHHT